MQIPATDRRSFLNACSKLGLAGTLFPGVLWAMADAEPKKITVDMISQAAVIADVPIPDEDREMMLRTLQDAAKGYDDIYNLHMDNGVQPAMVFDPFITTDAKFEKVRRPMQMSPALPGLRAPKNIEDVAFANVRDLAELLKTRKISSTALTQMYLERLKRYDPILFFVITLTEDRALAQAKEADRAIAAGKYRGPLHGIPWGAKDLLAVIGIQNDVGSGAV